jgi:hypothetical protein
MARAPCTFGPEDPLRLKVAVKVAFPAGGMTVSGLRREARCGRLVIERIAGKDFTTLAAIEKMRGLCRLQQKDRASGCVSPGAAEPGASPMPPSISSETANIRRAQAAALATVTELKENSKPISTGSIRRKRAGASVIPLTSPSRTS